MAACASRRGSLVVRSMQLVLIGLDLLFPSCGTKETLVSRLVSQLGSALVGAPFPVAPAWGGLLRTERIAGDGCVTGGFRLFPCGSTETGCVQPGLG